MKFHLLVLQRWRGPLPNLPLLLLSACEFFSGYIIEQLGADRTFSLLLGSLSSVLFQFLGSAAHVETVLGSFCERAPLFLKTNCVNWVRANKVQIALVLNSGGSAAQICSQIGACTSSSSDKDVAMKQYERHLRGEAGCDGSFLLLLRSRSF
jgi:hypothetical protein